MDKTAPIVNITRGSITTQSIDVSVNSVDNESGMTLSTEYKYYIKETSSGSYALKATTTATSYTFNGLKQNTSYDIKDISKKPWPVIS